MKILFRTAMLLILFTGCARNNPDFNQETVKVYIDPAAAVSGDGGISAPHRFWSEVSFLPGHSYLQKRDTVAREQVIVNASGTADAPIVIGAYGSGAAPVIQGSEQETGWALVSGAIYSKAVALQPGEGLGVTVQDGAALTRHEWNTDAATTFASAAAGSFSFDYATGTVYAWCTDGLAPDTHVMEVSRRHYGVRGANAAHVRVEDLHVRYTSLHGIVFENGTHVTVSGCTIEKLGGAYIAAGPLFAGNGIEFGNSSAHCAVDGCAVSDIFDSGISPQTYASNHAASDFTFTNSTVARCGFAGVEIASLYNGGMLNCSISGVVMRNLSVSGSGTGWSGRRYGTEGRGIKINADIAGADATRSLSGVTIEDSEISGCAGEGIFIGGNAGTVTVRRSTVRDSGGTGILAQEPEATTLLLDVSASVIRDNGSALNQHGIAYNVPFGKGVRVRQCTFYDNEFIGLNIWSHDGEAVIVNNAFHSSALRAHLLVNEDISATAQLEHNFFTEFGAAQPIINYQGTVYDFASDFDTAYTFAGGSVGAADPLLNADLTLQNTGSPCHHAGMSATGIAADRTGAPFHTPPSIGAFEY